MKTGALILLAGLLVCATTFSGIYYLRTAESRTLMSQPEPALAWLKKEFHLTDAEYARIVAMHEAYLPQCRERCQRIAEQDRKLEKLLATQAVMTPEVRAVIAERATTRAECEAAMLEHFLEVSRTMPPEQGRRYLEWVENQSSLCGQGMEQQHQTAEPHHH
jgi:hypothetical protein